MVKTCTKCGVEKSFGEYYKHPNGKYGLQARCKSCRKKTTREHDKNNPDKVYTRNKNHHNKLGKGVYGIFSGETCLYVGESVAIQRRINHHKNRLRSDKWRKSNFEKKLYACLNNHNNIEFKILEQTDNHKEQEQVWIDYLNPLYNAWN